jgi:SAM-dependent methyltransferase
MKHGNCRFCKTELKTSVVDLGMSPLANAYIKPERKRGLEYFFPLHAFICEKCFLVQVEEFETPQAIFSDYAYFSSYSKTWLEHCQNYTDLMVEKFEFNPKSLVIEIASNDGYLLQYFKEKNIPVLGIEPAENVAKVAEQKGIPTVVKFFGVQTAQALIEQGKKADLLLGNNVLAHVPDLNDFVKGMKMLLNDRGVLTMEFPHLLNLIEENQFDTIYHEHFSYFSLQAVEKVFNHHGLALFDVQELPTHGGSLRIYAHHKEDTTHKLTPNIDKLKEKEVRFGLDKLATYKDFKEKVCETKRKLLEFLIEAKRAKKTIVGYGAPAKGNTLLNYCGVRQDFLDYTVDISPHKVGCLLPGTHIPIEHPDKIKETKPDYVLILPWNFKDEIMGKTQFIREWGGKFVIPIPEVHVID